MLWQGPKVRVGRAGNTFSTKMLFRALLICGSLFLCYVEAVGPVVSNNEWTPVVNSRRVYLSPEVLEKYRQEEASASQAQER